MSAEDDLTKDQLVELEQIFRDEGLEHIKRLAELLFQMEEQGTDEDRLVEAFRQAHNLKGSSALLGFDRVARMTHRLEDVLGVLKQSTDPLTTTTLDLLLGALDIIREAVETHQVGEDLLSPEEQATVEALEQWLKTRSQVAPPTPEDTAASNPGVPASSTPAPASPEPASAESDTFIRVTASGMDELTAQVDDLFEAQVLVEGFGRELNQVRQGVARLRQVIGAQGTSAAGADDDEAGDLADLLHVRLEAATGHFERNMQGLSRRIRTAQEQVSRMGLATLDTLHVKLRRQVREVSRITGKPAELRFYGREHAVDRRVLEAFTEPLVHLIRNAVDHGIESAQERLAAGKPETGLVELRARHLGDTVELTIRDDGRGIDLQAIRASLVAAGQAPAEVAKLTEEQLADQLFQSGFSTRLAVSETSGRGVGLDVVKHTMDRVGGEVRLQTRVGHGTTVSLRLPLSMSAVRSLLVAVNGRTMAIPAANVQKVLILKPSDLLEPGQGEVVTIDGQHVPITSLHSLLGLPVPQLSADTGRKAVVLQLGDRRWAVTVDDVLEYTQVIVKPLGDLLERVPNLSGLALLADGELALMLNPGDLVRNAGVSAPLQTEQRVGLESKEEQADPVILVVDDSIATRTLERTLLESAGYSVLTATDGYDALDVLTTRRCDLVITDAQMPNMDGFELTRTLKSRAPLAHLPVIMITSLGSPEDIERGMASGADAYVVKKNLTQHELVSTITQLL